MAEPATGRLAGRRVVVTGAGGISTAVARRCADDGARVHVISRDAEEIERLRASVPEATGSVADLSDDAATAAAFDAAERAMGLPDGLVAVAGGSARRFGDGPVDALTADAVRATADLDLVTTLLAPREFTARRIAAGAPAPAAPAAAAAAAPAPAAAVLIGSVLARRPASPLFVTHAYAAMKAGIEGAARSAAAHYADRGITVNVVAPGLTRTPMARRAQEDPEVSAYARRRQPLAPGGFVDPADVADACAWLLGAGAVTGQVIEVDGGWGVLGG